MKNELTNPLLTKEQFSFGLMNPNPEFKPANRDHPDRYFIRFEVERDVFNDFTDAGKERTGMILGCVAVVGDGQAPIANKRGIKVKGEFGQYAKRLKMDGVFRNPKIWEAIGTDDEYHEWVTYQPSALSGKYSETVLGEGRCVPCHVRHIENGSGTGIKPKYSIIPLTDEEHKISHSPGNYEGPLTNREWWAQQRIHYVEKWAWETIKKTLKVESMSQVSPKVMVEWATSKRVEDYLPK